MSKPLTIEDRISILLTMIFDEGVDEYNQNFTKLLQRLNEFYDTNKVDIINYFTKVIMFIPTKGTIYANALHNFGKGDIINNIFKKLVEELTKTKNSFIFIRSFIFIFGLIHFGVLQNEQLVNFILENIGKKNKNLLQILIRSIFLIFRKNNEYQFLIQSINVIYDSNVIDKSDIILEILHTYANSDDSFEINENKNKFDGFFIKDIPANNTEKNNEDNNDINMTDSNNVKISDVDNIFNELNNINYENIFCLKLISRKYLSKNSIKFLDIYYELFLMNNIEAFKDEPNEGSKIYLFSLPNIYYNIKTQEQNNGINPYQFIIDNFPFASMDLVLYPLWTKGDLCYIVNFIVNVLSQKNMFFKNINEENNKEENIYLKFIISLISDNDLIQSLSHFQINNLIFFLYHIISNISDTKIEILSQIQKLKLNNSNDNINNAITYFINSFYEKISFIIKKESLPSEILFPEKDLTPMKNESLYSSSFYNEISTNVNKKENFNNFNKNLFEKDDQNEVLYTFIYCILNPNNINSTNALSKIYENLELYENGIRDIINNFEKKNNNLSLENDKMKIILKVIFDLYGNIPLYYIYIIDLLAFKNLLNHITIINFIFTEKLFQKKENGLFYGFYELINNCVENCYNMLTKFDDDFQNSARSFSKVDENQRKEMQIKMEFYDNEVEKLKKQKDIICDKIMELFFKLYEISEKLGGGEYKIFIKNVIKNEFALFQTRYKVSDEWKEKIKNLDN